MPSDRTGGSGRDRENRGGGSHPRDTPPAARLIGAETRPASPIRGSAFSTIARCCAQITNWHITRGDQRTPPRRLTIRSNVSRRPAFEFRNFANYRIRALLDEGKPNWDLLASVAPRKIRRALRRGRVSPGSRYREYPKDTTPALTPDQGSCVKRERYQIVDECVTHRPPHGDAR